MGRQGSQLYRRMDIRRRVFLGYHLRFFYVSFGSHYFGSARKYYYSAGSYVLDCEVVIVWLSAASTTYCLSNRVVVRVALVEELFRSPLFRSVGVGPPPSVVIAAGMVRGYVLL